LREGEKPNVISDDINSRLTPIFRDVLDDPGLTPNRELTADDIGEWDSLSHVRLMLTAALYIAGAAVYLTALFFTIYLVYFHTIRSPLHLAWRPYGFSELLINYNAGFLRRGLIGAAIHHFAGSKSALPVTDFLIFTNFCILVAAIVLLVVFAGRRNLLLRALLVLVIPGGVFAWSISNDFFYRKEAFFLSTMAVTALAVSLLRRLDLPYLRRALAIALTISIFVSGILLSLVHEAFIFLAAPANLFLLFAVGRWMAPKAAEDTIAVIQKRLFLLYSGMVGIVFLVSFIFRGGKTTADVMWRELNPLDRAMINPAGTIEGGMMTIKEGFLKSMVMPGHIFIYGMAWFWLVPIICLMLYCLAVVALDDKGNSPQSAGEFKRWAVTYVVLFMGTVPVFILGWDWGRWVASINLSFLILWLSILPTDAPDWFIRFLREKVVKRHPSASEAGALAERCLAVVRRRPRWTAAVLLLFALTFRLPEGPIDALDTEYIVHYAAHGLKIALSARPRSSALSGEK
jgi:hypothetical protein